MIGNLFGLRLIESEYAIKEHTKQVRFPRSKRRRIRKKWAKRKENWHTWYEPVAYQLADGTLICHPSIVAQMKVGERK